MRQDGSGHPHPPPNTRALVTRLFLHLTISVGLLGVSLGLGMWGYEHYEQMKPRDAFVNSAMLLAGMGPVKTDLSEPGKIFAGVYALYSGLIVIGVTGLMLTPAVHHVMKTVHWEEHKN